LQAAPEKKDLYKDEEAAARRLGVGGQNLFCSSSKNHSQPRLQLLIPIPKEHPLKMNFNGVLNAT